jgi:CheY-like chemotaxis protein
MIKLTHDEAGLPAYRQALSSACGENERMKKVLVVDDQPDIRKLLSMTLEDDFEVLLASNGEQALDIAKTHQPFAILLDIMMPGGIDGIGVLNTIKSSPELKQIRVAMVTARGQQEDLKTGQNYGADAYFVKPFSPLQILAWLHDEVDFQQQSSLG